MYLAKLELNGFKSFANKTTLEFTPGITSIVGPNGSGKSNVADGIRWVLGEQSMKMLRGKKSEDVIFGGTDKKGRLGLAEVSLHLNNEDRSAPIDYTQLVITRRVFRDGRGEYLINKNPARLQDILLLLAQANFGQKTYSVIGQGMVDEVLSSSPAERKALFEDAAGVRQYQMKKDEAVLKLQRTRDNLTQARALMQEIEPRLRSLTRQIKRLERRDEIEQKLFAAQRQYYAGQWSEIDEHHHKIETAVDGADTKRQAADKELKLTQGELEKFEKDKTTSEAFQQLQRDYNKILEEKNHFLEEQAELKSRLELGARQDGAADLVWLGKRRDELEGNIKELKDEQQVISQSKERLAEQLKTKQEEQAGIVREFEELEQRMIGVRQSLKNQNTIKLEDIRYELDKLDAIQASLLKLGQAEEESVIPKFQKEVSRLAQRLLSFRQRVEKSDNIADPQEYLDLQAQLSEAFRSKDNSVNEVTSVHVQVEVKEDQEGRLQDQLNTLEAEKLKISNQISHAKDAPASKEEAYQQYLKTNASLRRQLEDIDNRLTDVREKISDYSDVEQKKKEKLFAQQKMFRDTQRKLNDIVNTLNEHKVDLARTETRKEDLEREMREALPAEQLEKIFTMAQKKSWDRNLHRDDLSTEIQRLKHQLDLIGGIEEGTTDEYQETNKRYEYLSQQSNDLDESIANLEQVIDELDETIKKRFDLAFDRINKEFQRFFKTLFAGGQAKLALLKEVVQPPVVESDDDQDSEEVEEEAEAQPVGKQEKVIAGIDIQASPPGKRLKGINMLSGGERALTSIALICAIIYNNPSPFVVLDEVDAALDEANSRRFASIVEKLISRTQFVTITHNRATMERSKILYGVTMGSDGVSKLLSMKLEDAEEVIKKAGNR